MRITGGRIKGRVLVTPKGIGIRPTSDKVRESIFNILGQDLHGLRILDLFAGTGSLGLESLSRGAERAVFIDNDRLSLRLIKKNLTICGYEDSALVLKKDLAKGLPSVLRDTGKSFDLIFADPPYGKGLILFLLKRLPDTGLLCTGSVIVAETSREENLPEALGWLKAYVKRNYGDTSITLYAYEVNK